MTILTMIIFAGLMLGIAFCVGFWLGLKFEAGQVSFFTIKKEEHL